MDYILSDRAGVGLFKIFCESGISFQAASGSEPKDRKNRFWAGFGQKKSLAKTIKPGSSTLTQITSYYQTGGHGICSNNFFERLLKVALILLPMIYVYKRFSAVLGGMICPVTGFLVADLAAPTKPITRSLLWGKENVNVWKYLEAKNVRLVGLIFFHFCSTSHLLCNKISLPALPDFNAGKLRFSDHSFLSAANPWSFQRERQRHRRDSWAIE